MHVYNVTSKNSASHEEIPCDLNPQHLFIEKKKSKNMNLKFKSSEPDLKFDIQSQFRIINGNILYLTREVDKLVRLAKQDSVDGKLQQQVDKYFDEDETSPQTDSESKVTLG